LLTDGVAWANLHPDPLPAYRARGKRGFAVLKKRRGDAGVAATGVK
jgi:hypothetical protein